jgi:glycosyltransferase involved in cell wall biosynthesis
MVSLVLATVNRTSEVDRLLASLDAQTYRNFEIILVDQNPDERLAGLLMGHPNLRIQHLRSAPGLSRARNVALPIVSGDIVAFPDDDCWYPPQLLSSVADWFSIHQDFDALIGIMRTPEGNAILPRWAPSAGPCVKANLWDCAFSTTIFLRRTIIEQVGPFNEYIGVGAASSFQSGEESDYLLRALSLGFRTWYEPTIWLHHPNLASIGRMGRTAYSFALGAGYVMRMHGYSWAYVAIRMIRAIGGASLSICKGDVPRSRAYVLRALGQLRGYALGPRDMARLGARAN